MVCIVWRPLPSSSHLSYLTPNTCNRSDCSEETSNYSPLLHPSLLSVSEMRMSPSVGKLTRNAISTPIKVPSQWDNLGCIMLKGKMYQSWRRHALLLQAKVDGPPTLDPALSRELKKSNLSAGRGIVFPHIWLVNRSFHSNDFVHDSKMKIYANLSEMMINGGFSYLFWECRLLATMQMNFKQWKSQFQMGKYRENPKSEIS